MFSRADNSSRDETMSIVIWWQVLSGQRADKGVQEFGEDGSAVPERAGNEAVFKHMECG